MKTSPSSMDSNSLYSLAEACAKAVLDTGYTGVDRIDLENYKAALLSHLQPLAKDREDAAKALEWALSWAEIAIADAESKGVKMEASKEWYAKHEQTLKRTTPKPASSS